MSPYLTNLLSRSFTVEPPLRPQASTQFVNKPAAARELWALPVEDESVSELLYKDPGASHPVTVSDSGMRDDRPDLVPDDAHDKPAAGERFISAGLVPGASLSSRFVEDAGDSKPVVTGRESPLLSYSELVVDRDQATLDPPGDAHRDKRLRRGFPATPSTSEKAVPEVPKSIEANNELRSVIVSPLNHGTARARAEQPARTEVEPTSGFEASASRQGKRSADAMERSNAVDTNRTVNRTGGSQAFFLESEGAISERAPRDTTGAKSKPDAEPGTRPTEARPLFAASNVGRAPQRAARVSSREQQPSDREQVIEVTIGRIEVRASVTEDRRPREPRTATLPSLEDYLRRRSGKSAHE